MILGDLDADFLKISHLEARLRGEPEPKFLPLPDFFLDPGPAAGRLSPSGELFDFPSLGLLPSESSSNGPQLKRKACFSAKENVYETAGAAQAKRNSLGAGCVVKKKVRPDGVGPNLAGPNPGRQGFGFAEAQGFGLGRAEELSRISTSDGFEAQRKEKLLSEENGSLKRRIETLGIEFQVRDGEYVGD